MDKTFIQALLIEADPVDAASLREALTADPSTTFELTTAQTLDQGFELLQEGAFDTILLASDSPDGEETEALEKLRRRVPDKPILLVGSDDEIDTLLAIRAGAQDVLIHQPSGWDSPGRTIRHAIERQHIRTSLTANEQRSQALIENSADAIALITADGTISYESPSTTRLMGYSPEELVGRSAYEFVHPDDRAALFKAFTPILDNPQASLTERMRLKHKNGTWHWMEVTITNLLEEPAVQAIVINYHDITERKQAEERIKYLNRLYLTLGQVNQAIVRVQDPQELFEKICTVAVEFGGFRMAWVGLLDPATGDIVPQAWSGYEDGYLRLLGINIYAGDSKETASVTAIRTGSVVIRDDIQADSSMQHYWNATLQRGYRSLAAIPFRQGGEIIGVLPLYAAEPVFFTEEERTLLEEIGLDISFALDTLESRKERQRATEALLASERRFREILENVNLVAVTLDVEGKITFCNNYLLELTGWQSGEVVGRDWFELFIPRDLDLRKMFQATIATGSFPLHHENEILTRKGERRLIAWNNTVLRDPQGHIIGTNSIGQDITEHKQAEQAIQNSEQKYRSLFSEMLSGCALHELICDKDGVPVDYLTLDVNRAYENILNVKSDTVIGKKASEILPKDELRQWLEIFSPVALTGQSTSYEIFSPLNQKYFEGNAFCPEIGKFAVTFTDVTERRQAEATLREAQQLYENVFRLSPEVIVVTTEAEGRYLAASEAHERVTGYRPEEVIGHNVAEFGAWESVTERQKMLDILHEQGMVLNREVQFHRKSGEPYTALLSMAPIELGGERCLVSVITDISERKQAEIERQTLLEIMRGLAVTEDLPEFLRLVHQSIARVIYAENFFVILYNKDTQLFEEVYSVDQYDPPTPPSRLEKSGSAYVFRSGEPLLLTQERFDELVAQGEMELIGTNSPSWLGVPLKTSRETIGMMVVQDYENEDRYSEHDVDFFASIAGQVALAIQRRQAEGILRENAEKLALAQRIGGFGGWEMGLTPDSELIEPALWSDECYRIFGYEPGSMEITSEFLLSCAHPEDRATAYQGFMDAIQKRSEYSHEFRIVRPDGTIRYIHDQAKVVLDERSGQAIKVVGIVQDITERKQSEEALRESEARYRTLYENSAVGIYRTTPDGRILLANPALVEMLGYAKFNELATRNLTKSGYEMDYDRSQFLEIIEKEGEVKGLESSWTRQDGTSIHVSETARAIRDAAGHAMYYDGIVEDITERKRAEQALRVAEEDYRSIFDKAPIGIYQSTPEGRFLKVNPAMASIYGYDSPENMVSSITDIGEQLYVDPNARLGLKPVLTEQGEVFNFESHDRRKDGSHIWTSMNARAVKNATGAVMYYEGFIQDITERKLAEQALRTSEAQLSDAMDISRLGYWEYDFERDLFIFNDHFYSIFHTTAEWEGGYTMTAAQYTQRFIHPDDASVVSAEMQKALETTDPNYSRLLEHRILYADGETGYLAVRLFVGKDEQGRTIKSFGTNQDITERKRIEENLRQSRELLHQTFVSLREAVFIIDAETVELVDCNPAACEMFGYNRSEMIGRTTAFLHVDAAALEEFRRLLYTAIEENGFLFLPDFHMKRKDGSIFSTEHAVIPLRNKEEKINGWVSVVHDTTERKLAEQALRESETRYRTLFDGMLDGVYRSSHDGKFLDVNPAMVKMFGFDSREQMLEVDIKKDLYFAPEERESLFLDTGQEKVDFFRMRRKDGSEIWVEDHGRYVHDAQGNVIFHEGILRDITERKLAEEQVQRYAAELEQRVAERTADLSRVNAELERAARAKDEFLASMSHELRTPLSAVLTLAESLEEGIYGPLGDRQLKPVRNISESGNHLLSLINDILDISKIEAGKVELQIEPVELEPLCQASLRLVRQQAQRKGLYVALDPDPEVKSVRADARRLKQILVNLLSNAVKFTPEGGQIGLEVRGDAKQGIVRFTVWDTGIGIAAEDVPKLFKPFTQLDSGLARQFSGTGLGLSLVYRLAEMHGGSVTVVSAPEQGSRFTISLPWAGPGESRGTGPLIPWRAPKLNRALIIEDSPTAADQLSRYLSELGAQVTLHTAGGSALEKAIEARPEVIILDIRLPDISGWEVLARLKADVRTHMIPIIVVTVVDEPERGLAMGAAEYLVKPITRPRLYEALWKALVPGREAGSNGSETNNEGQPKILIAEDNLTTQTTYSDFLSAKGYRVIVAANGAEAIERTREIRPDLILMDIQMPGMDGLETTRRLRSDPDLSRTPIIALTALVMPGDRERCLDAGANDYLTKPLSLKQLILTIETFLQKNGA